MLDVGELQTWGRINFHDFHSVRPFRPNLASTLIAFLSVGLPSRIGYRSEGQEVKCLGIVGQSGAGRVWVISQHSQ